MPRIATAPALIIGLLSASLFGLFYMAALNNPIINRPPKPIAAAPAPKPAAAPVTIPTPAPPPPVAAAQPVAPDLTRELTRAELREVQTLLKSAGYDPGPADGLMGRKTRAAIASFGEAHDLDLTPEPRLKLLEALRATAR